MRVEQDAALVEGAAAAAGAPLGMSAVSVHYEATHLLAHLPYRPRSRLGRTMRRAHLLHHFQNDR